MSDSRWSTSLPSPPSAVASLGVTFSPDLNRSNASRLNSRMAFNVADSCITVGAVLLLLSGFLGGGAPLETDEGGEDGQAG